MSATFQYLLSKMTKGQVVGTAEAGSPVVPLGEGPAGWVFFGLSQRLPLELLDRAVGAMAAESGSPSLGVYVETSDWGYVVAADDTGVTCAALINGNTANEFSQGAWALRRCIEQAGQDTWEPEAASRLAEWSRAAPTRVSKSKLLAFLEDDHLFPEEAMEGLLKEFGLDLPPPEPIPSLEDRGFREATFLHEQGTSGGPVSVNRSRVRYVLGEGDGFVGIWDRRAPGPPIRRFSPDQRWESFRTWLLLVLDDYREEFASWTVEDAMREMSDPDF